MSTTTAKSIDAPLHALPLGETLALDQRLMAGRYRLLHRLADGAMGTVWAGQDEIAHRRVAVKLLHSRYSANDVDWSYLKQRLLREARITARVRHHAVVRARDQGVTTTDEPYLVMEFLDGKSLERILARRGVLAPTLAVRLLLPIAKGLAAVHASGVVHRDVKPENVFFARTSDRRIQPKLIDFGVAKELDPRRRQHLTGAGVIGTPGYMPPEQALDSSDVDGRSDVWAFCAMFYEVLAGRVPFPGATCSEVLRAALEQEPVPLTATMGLDRDLWAIIARGLDRDRTLRWPGMPPLAAALQAWLSDHARK